MLGIRIRAGWRIIAWSDRKRLGVATEGSLSQISPPPPPSPAHRVEAYIRSLVEVHSVWYQRLLRRLKNSASIWHTSGHTGVLQLEEVGGGIKPTGGLHIYTRYTGIHCGQPPSPRLPPPPPPLKKHPEVHWVDLRPICIELCGFVL